MLMGPVTANDYLMRASLMTGVEVERIGLVTHRVSKDQVLASGTEDSKEAVKAFVEKRKGVYHGR
jgi:enoyl-CoA hydratase/carnithine racemase